MLPVKNILRAVYDVRKAIITTKKFRIKTSKEFTLLVSTQLRIPKSVR